MFLENETSFRQDQCIFNLLKTTTSKVTYTSVLFWTLRPLQTTGVFWNERWSRNLLAKQLERKKGITRNDRALHIKGVVSKLVSYFWGKENKATWRTIVLHPGTKPGTFQYLFGRLANSTAPQRGKRDRIFHQTHLLWIFHTLAEKRVISALVLLFQDPVMSSCGGRSRMGF